MIPAEWKIESLENLVDYDTGRTPARANSLYWEGDGARVPWVAISDMENYGTISKTQESITRLAFDDVFRKRIVHAGTLLMSFKLTIGRVSTLGIDACHNEAIISIRPKERVDQRYLGYFLSQVNYDDLQDRQIKGNTLNQDKINRIPVTVPTKEEQSEIADVLDCVRRAIALEVKAEEVASSLKRVATRTLFSRGLRSEAQKETEIGFVPESWVRTPIFELGQIVTGTTPPTKDSSSYIGGEIPFIAPGDFDHGTRIARTEKKITQRGLSFSRALRKGTTCFVCIGSTIGKVGLVMDEVSSTNQQINSIIPLDDFNDLYVFYLMTFWSEYIRKQASPSPVPILSKGAFEKIVIFTTRNKDEQQEIATILDAVDRKINLHKQKSALLEDLFKSLLHKLMTGEIRVADLDLSALGQVPLEGAVA